MFLAGDETNFDQSSFLSNLNDILRMPPNPDQLPQPGPPRRNPQPLDVNLSDETVDLFKRYTCKFYEHCLNTACDQNWQQFHCNACTVFEEIPEMARSNRKMVRLALMLEKIHEEDGGKVDGQEGPCDAQEVSKQDDER